MRGASRAFVGAALAALFVTAAGCTFGGLASYAIEQCDSAATQASDACDRLNKDDPQSCTPYQCNPATHHCIQKTRDDDRDGDPSLACGGTDCDDKDSARSGRAKESCDLVDNNCNGVIDEDVVKPGTERVVFAAGGLTSSADPSLNATTPRDLVAAYVLSSGQGRCIPLVELQPGGGRPRGTGCALLADEATLVPHQPSAVLVGPGAGAAFVSTSACTVGHLAYRFAANASTGFDVPCDPAHPATLPALSVMPESANAKSGIVAWYEAPIGDRADPVGGCASLKPAPLAITLLDDLTAPSAPSASSVLRSSEESPATRPPSMVAVDQAHGMAIAAPLGGDVGVWLLTRDGLKGPSLPAAQHVPALAGARATGLAVHAEGAVLKVALVAEVGCHPAASIVLVLGTLDASNGKFAFGAPVEVTPKSDVATQPTVAWVPGRQGEWWVSWIDDHPQARVRRLDHEGKPIGAAIDVGHPLIVGAVSAGESVFGFDPTANGGAFVEVPLGCAP